MDTYRQMLKIKVGIGRESTCLYSIIWVVLYSLLATRAPLTMSMCGMCIGKTEKTQPTYELYLEPAQNKKLSRKQEQLYKQKSARVSQVQI